ncbi:tetratricopeptide repeat protein [Kitasatospora sp. NPDC057015]|uniref:tetratricopeptide repeat protein n=1 Tax=Kitasatospora sp. NPDC057015 TaxID=3346001 RepID=UPI00362F1119
MPREGAAGSDVSDAAIGTGSRVGHTELHGTASGNARLFQAGRDVNIHLRQEAAPAPVQWPVLVGTVPPKASAFQTRTELRKAVDSARERSGTVVLSQVLAGQGGVGKSQLAASYARQALDAGTDLVVWADATQPAGVLAAYADAARQVRAPGAAGRPEEVEQDADAFLRWLATTDRSWLVVLDNATEQTPDGLWPGTSRGGRGRVIATTRLRGAEASDAGRALVDVGVYSARESAAYLRQRLEAARCAHLLDDTTADLAEALGHLPLALAYAAAYLIRRRRSAGRYLRLFHDRAQTLEDVLPARTGVDGYQRSVTAALLLSLDAARQEEPLAVPALSLTALLDPAGHPEDLWATTPVLDYLTGARTTAVDGSRPAEADEGGDGVLRVRVDDALDALAVLHNYSLVTLTEERNRQVTLHALTARATLDTVPAGQRPYGTAADALVALWPKEDHLDRDLAAVLRLSTDTLADHAGDRLWEQPGTGYSVLFRSGFSLHEAGLQTAGIRHWEQLAATADRLLGPEHPDTLAFQSGVASSYHQAGRTADAIALEERVLADRERTLGPDHPHTLTARNNLAGSYRQAGRTDDAITLQERVVAERERLLGPEHPDTLTTRHNLAHSYQQAGRMADAIAVEEGVLADRERLLGPDHPHTLTTRHNLAASYQLVGRTDDATVLLERVVADRERLLGPDHPETLTTRGNLANSYRRAGRTDEAITMEERVLADRERILGPDHADNHVTRHNLASSYRQAGRIEDAITLQEHVVADTERLLGPEHPDTHVTRHNLAYCYHQVGRTDDAIALLDSLVKEPVVGSRHPNMVASRVKLAVVLTERGLSLLPGDVAGAWRDAAAAVQAVGPHLDDRPARYGTALTRAYLLAADALDADGQPEAAAEFRRRALAVADAASTTVP